MSTISTVVFDTAQGCPAANLEVALAYLQENGLWLDLGTGPTDDFGRIPNLLPRSFPLKAGMYRLSLSTSHYFSFSGMNGTFPVVPIVLEVTDTGRTYAVQLSLSRYGYNVSIT